MKHYDVRYLWVAAGEICKGTYAGDKGDIKKKIEADGNKVISMKKSKMDHEIVYL